MTTQRRSSKASDLFAFPYRDICSPTFAFMPAHRYVTDAGKVGVLFHKKELGVRITTNGERQLGKTIRQVIFKGFKFASEQELRKHKSLIISVMDKSGVSYNHLGGPVRTNAIYNLYVKYIINVIQKSRYAVTQRVAEFLTGV